MHVAVGVAAVLVATLLVGVEFSVGVFVHPLLWRMDDGAHAQAARLMAKLFGKVMPVWYAGTLVGVIAVVFGRVYGTVGWWAGVLSAALFAGSIVYSLVGPVPINNRVVAWDLEALPANWKQDRRRWDQLHRIRVVMLIAGAALLVVAVAGSA